MHYFPLPMYPLKLYFRHLPNLIMTGLGFLINAAAWLWPLMTLHPEAGEQIFLHYNILYGVDYAGDYARLLYLPLTGTVILTVNTLLAWSLFQKDKVIAYVLGGVSVFSELFLFVAVLLLIFLNA